MSVQTLTICSNGCITEILVNKQHPRKNNDILMLQKYTRKFSLSLSLAVLRRPIRAFMAAIASMPAHISEHLSLVFISSGAKYCFVTHKADASLLLRHNWR